MTPPTEYVIGFLFDPPGRQVALINKTHPKWQAGKLNGVGGHIELDETAEQAMCREFREEAGRGFQHLDKDWRHFATMTGTGCGEGSWLVYCFTCFLDRPSYYKKTFHRASDERVRWVEVRAAIMGRAIVPNLAWLIPMALAGPKGLCVDNTWPFFIAEAKEVLPPPSAMSRHECERCNEENDRPGYAICSACLRRSSKK